MNTKMYLHNSVHVAVSFHLQESLSFLRLNCIFHCTVEVSGVIVKYCGDTRLLLNPANTHSDVLLCLS
jgi:hypothetical protein